jgi:single-strand DNA-binding protein
MSFDKHIVMGNLGKDPELRYTPQGTPVASFPLCSNEKRRGEKVQNWFDVSIFGNSADVASQYLRKGHTIYVEGREEVDLWEKRDGTPAISRKLTTNSFQFVTKPNGGDGSAAAPANAESAATAESAPGGDLTDDDVPF